MIYFNGKLNYHLAKMSKEELEEYSALLLEVIDCNRVIIQHQAEKINTLEQIHRDDEKLMISNLSYARLVERLNKFADNIRDTHSKEDNK